MVASLLLMSAVPLIWGITDTHFILIIRALLASYQSFPALASLVLAAVLIILRVASASRYIGGRYRGPFL